jgi:HSP20 family protein
MFSLMPWRREKGRADHPFQLMRRELDAMFDRFFGSWPVRIEESLLPTLPPVEVDEEEKEFLVRVELPGFEASEIDVQMSGTRLLIRARREEKEGDKEAHTAEVARAIDLFEEVDVEKIEAVYRNGVLEVKLPKAPSAANRRIEIKTEPRVT